MALDPKDSKRATYRLGDRQERTYRWRCEIWLPRPVQVNAKGKGRVGGSYDPEPDYIDIPCRFIATPEVDDPKIFGRTKQVNFFTLDKLELHVRQEIKDTCLVRVTAPGFAEEGGFWVVQGNPISLNTPRWGDEEEGDVRRTAHRVVSMKRGPKPPGVNRPKA